MIAAAGPGTNQQTIVYSPKMNIWAVLSDEQMSNEWPFSFLIDEQMSNKVGVEHQPDMSPWKGTTFFQEISSSNHQFSGD